MNAPSANDLLIPVRTRVLAWLMITTIYTFTVKFYRGPGQDFVNNWGPASVGYVTFFMLAAVFFFPKRSAILPIAICVLSVTCFLEFAQLWQPEWLQGARKTFFGRALLGSEFSWFDFPAYFLGAVVGSLLLHFLLRTKRNVDPASP